MLVLSTGLPAAPAQTAARDFYYAQRNTLGISAAYSPNSSRILLGDAGNRRLLNIGISYDHRLFVNRVVNWQYSAEFMPVALESDPTETLRYTITTTNPPGSFTGTITTPIAGSCQPFSGTFTAPGQTETIDSTCGRRWTIGEAMSPVGLRWSFLPLRKAQPFVDGHGGYMYSTQPIPADNAGSFNFTFDIGAGFELYRSKTRSMRVEYRYHHISNDNLATANPGIDSGLIQFTWCFGVGRRQSALHQ